jgi:hypothetical protein
MEYAKRLWQQLLAKSGVSQCEPGSEGKAVGGGSNHKSCSLGRWNVKPGEALGGGSTHKYRLGEAPVGHQRINSTGKSFAMQHNDRNSSAYQQTTRAGVNKKKKKKNQHEDERLSEETNGGVSADVARTWNPDPHKQWTNGALAHADSILASLDATLANFIGQLKTPEVPART